MTILDIPFMVIRNTVSLFNRVEIVNGVTLWTFLIALFIVTAVCSMFWRSGKY